MATIILAAATCGFVLLLGLGTSTATVSKPMKLSEIQDYPGKAFLSVIAGNRFSVSDMERFEGEHGHLPLPSEIPPPVLVTSQRNGKVHLKT